MTTHNRANETMCAIINKARKKADDVLDKERRGMRWLPRGRRAMGNPVYKARYDKVVEETRRLGLKIDGGGLLKGKLGRRGGRRRVTVALTPAQIADRNRHRLLKAVSRRRRKSRR